MVIDLRKHHQLTSGDAHLVEADGKMYKLFTPNWRGEDAVKSIFRSQCRAYEIASADSYLLEHIACFYGRAAIDDVISPQGESIGDRYVLDCSYAMEVLIGREAKLTTPGLRDHNPHLTCAQRRFEEISIDVLDSSVFNYQEPDRFKFIDFKMRS